MIIEELADKLTKEDSWMINREAMRRLGVNPALLLATLYELEKEENELFVCTVETLRRETGLTSDQQRSALNKLEKCGFLDVEYKGLPKSRHIRLLNHDYKYK